MYLLSMQSISIMFHSSIDQRKLQTLSTQKMSTPKDLEAVLNKSNRSLKQMNIMNPTGIRILKIIHINEKRHLEVLEVIDAQKAKETTKICFGKKCRHMVLRCRHMKTVSMNSNLGRQVSTHLVKSIDT